jgi:hypothetical protein
MHLHFEPDRRTSKDFVIRVDKRSGLNNYAQRQGSDIARMILIRCQPNYLFCRVIRKEINVNMSGALLLLTMKLGPWPEMMLVW